MSQYVNLRTGGIITTRRDFGKGLAAIISAGVAPSIALGLAGSANASIGRGMMRNVGARQAAMFGGKSVPTAKDYVKDGLYALWDAIENGGFGIHLQTLSSWIDLSVNNRNAIAIGGPVFSDSSVQTGAGKYFNSNISFPFNLTSFTIETVFCPLQNVYNKQPLGSNGVGGFTLIGLSNNVWSSATGQPYAWCSFGTIETNTIHSICYLCSNRNVTTYTDLSVKGNASISNSTTTFGFKIGMSGNSQETVDAKFGCVRLYDRALSYDEIKSNFEIDKMRFGIV